MRHSLGRVIATAAIAAAVPGRDHWPARSPCPRDWGDLDAEDKAANDADHSHAEGRIFSSYDTEEHEIICVIKKFSASKRKLRTSNKAQAGNSVKIEEWAIVKSSKLLSDGARMNSLTSSNRSSWPNQLWLDVCVSL